MFLVKIISICNEAIFDEEKIIQITLQMAGNLQIKIKKKKIRQLLQTFLSLSKALSINVIKTLWTSSWLFTRKKSSNCFQYNLL